MIVFDDNEQPTQSQDQGTRNDDRVGQRTHQIDKPSSEAVLQAMTSDTPMVSPVQSVKPSPASKKTPVTGVRTGGEVRSASASSRSTKLAQSGSADSSVVPGGAAGDVQPMDVESIPMTIADPRLNH